MKHCCKIMLLCYLLLPFKSQAYSVQYGAVVIDASNGKVLHSESADSVTYPASLTKMMTLFIIFEALEARKINLDTLMRTSAHATTQAPSRLGLKVGEHITVKDAILAMIVKSANDVAVTVAEHLAGSEVAFAELMTRKARQLGMRHTTFKNASGLPNKHQKTTARDMALLGYSLYKKFPKYYRLFKTSSFNHNGQTYKSHNRLISQVPGCDGIKTGFINASGFNLVSSAKRNGKRYIVAVLGGKTWRERDKRSAELIELAFNDAQRRPNHYSRSVYASAKPLVSHDNQPRLDDLFRQVNHDQDDADDPLPALQPPLKDIRSNQVKETRLVTQTQFSRKEHSWSIQVGTFNQAAMAQSIAKSARRKLDPDFKSHISVTLASRRSKKKIYRARLTGFNEKQAQQSCKFLHQEGNPCMVVRPHRDPEIFTAMR